MCMVFENSIANLPSTGILPPAPPRATFLCSMGDRTLLRPPGRGAGRIAPAHRAGEEDEPPRRRRVGPPTGVLPKRPKGPGCNPGVSRLRRFKSFRPHGSPCSGHPERRTPAGIVPTVAENIALWIRVTIRRRTDPATCRAAW